MRIDYKLFSCIFLIVLLISCSTKKDAFLNRNFHAVTTEFNTLYNGQIAFDKGIEDINLKYEEDFWALLPIEAIRFGEKEIEVQSFSRAGGPGGNFNSGPNQNKNQATTFDRAEEKATKAIQRHSMMVYGVERNPQIDDAYLLLGKSRYYTQRFIPAIDAFNYIISKYPKANLVDETKVWKAKANVRLENEDVAISDLLTLLKKEKLEDNIIEQANTALAMAYQKKDSLEAVIDRLIRATKTDKNVIQRSRNLYILGQLYSQSNNKKAALATLEKLAAYKKAPYKFRLQAHMALAKDTEADSSITSLINRYKEMIANWDHRNHLDIINYHKGTLEEKRDSIENAIKSYKTALLFKKARPKIKSYSYEKLAEIYFNSNKFFLASSYYDSVLKIDKEETLRIKKIQRKYNSLAALINYESIVKYNDSVLAVVLMSEEDRVAYFQKYIHKLKAEDEVKRKAAKQSINFGSSFGNPSAKKQNRKDTRGKWYFYNPQSLSFGEGEFQRIWGNRPLVDNWRWSDKQKVKSNNNITRNNSKPKGKVTQTVTKYDVKSYLDKIPTETLVIDSLADQRTTALYELGLLYKERFQKDEIAIDRLERLLKLYPPKRLFLPTYYLLYDLYSKQKESKGVFYKRRIIRKHPKSTYAKVLSDPNRKPNSDEEVEEIKELYSLAYNLYHKQSYSEAISFIELSLETIDNSPLIPKFELLKAYCVGKIATKSSYKKTLERVYNNHPNSKQGRKALQISKRL